MNDDDLCIQGHSFDNILGTDGNVVPLTGQYEHAEEYMVVDIYGTGSVVVSVQWVAYVYGNYLMKDNIHVLFFLNLYNHLMTFLL